MAREIRLHSDLAHDSIIALYAAWKDKAYVYLALEWAPGVRGDGWEVTQAGKHMWNFRDVREERERVCAYVCACACACVCVRVCVLGIDDEKTMSTMACTAYPYQTGAATP